jgi:Asp-tRNA(Asn)/Glu-tRNA(Gln) amidotransferase A subunit family amidase
MYQKLVGIFNTYDPQICPTFAVPAVKAGRKHDEPMKTTRQSSLIQRWFMTYPFNVSLPVPRDERAERIFAFYRSPNRQIVGRTYDDLSVFRAAAAFEGATKRWKNNRPKF